MKLKFIKLNIIYKLIGYLAIVSVLPLLIFAVSSYDVVQETILDLTSEYSSQLVSNQRDYLQLQLQQVDNLASRIATIDEIGEVAVKTDASNDMKLDAYDDLSTQAEIRQNLNLYSSLKGVASIDFIPQKGIAFMSVKPSVSPMLICMCVMQCIVLRWLPMVHCAGFRWFTAMAQSGE